MTTWWQRLAGNFSTTPLVGVERWARIEPFLPTSPDQVKAYLKHQHYRIPVDRKTKRPTANEEALEELLRKNPSDPVLPLILDARRYTKAIGYLGDNILGRDGRLHPRYSFLPKTGRLSSKKPNLMNQPQGRKGNLLKMVADAIRGSFLPTPGYVLAEFDWRAVEALLTGYFAADPDYMRLAKLGVHAYNAAFGLYADGKIPEPASFAWPDDKLAAFLDNIKSNYKLEYSQFKKAGLSDQYGQGIFSLARDLRCDIKRAVWLKEMIRKAAPKVAAWKEATRLRAHTEGQLVNPFGYGLSFFEVFRPTTTGGWEQGKEANEALAFLPQSTCAAMLRWCLVELGTMAGEGTDFALLVPIHDAILVEIREGMVEHYMETIRAVMERPWPELGGLRVEIEAKVGATMGAMRSYHFPKPFASR